MLNYPKYKLMRTYSVDVFNKTVINIHKSFGDLMFEVYRERLNKNIINYYFIKQNIYVLL